MKQEILEVSFGAKDSELKGFEYYIPEGMEAEVKDGKVIIKPKESEDERMRKEIIGELKMRRWRLSLEGRKQDADKITNEIAYLERQKEQKVDIDKLRKDIYQSGYNDGYQHGKEDAQKEQKPAEWSEEDDAKWYGVIETEEYMLRVVRGEQRFDVGNKEIERQCEEELDWLKSLRPQSKREWSDEEKDMLNKIYECIGWAMDEHAFFSTKRLIGDNEGVKLQDFLRSIAKPQPHWKPSKEQMKALKLAYEDAFEVPESCVPHLPLKSLYEQLKSL